MLCTLSNYKLLYTFVKMNLVKWDYKIKIPLLLIFNKSGFILN